MGRSRGPGVDLESRGVTSGTYSSRLGRCGVEGKVRCHKRENSSGIIYLPNHAKKRILGVEALTMRAKGIVHPFGVHYDPLRGDADE
jgi:hypothetical protein